MHRYMDGLALIALLCMLVSLCLLIPAGYGIIIQYITKIDYDL